MSNNEESVTFRNSGKKISFTKEFLEDQLGEHDWNSLMIVRLPSKPNEAYRLLGRSKTVDNAWDYNVMVRDDQV